MKTSVVPADATWMNADEIREIDAAGTIHRSWRVPVDLYPIGIEGNTLLLARGSDHPIVFITIDQRGHIGTPPRPPKERVEASNCPYSFKDFSCVVIRKDPIRYLVYSPVCT